MFYALINNASVAWWSVAKNEGKTLCMIWYSTIIRPKSSQKHRFELFKPLAKDHVISIVIIKPLRFVESGLGHFIFVNGQGGILSCMRRLLNYRDDVIIPTLLFIIVIIIMLFRPTLLIVDLS